MGLGAARRHDRLFRHFSLPRNTSAPWLRFIRRNTRESVTFRDLGRLLPRVSMTQRARTRARQAYKRPHPTLRYRPASHRTFPKKSHSPARGSCINPSRLLSSFLCTFPTTREMQTMSETADSPTALDAFVRRWEASGAAERPNYSMFLNEFCDLLDVPRPGRTG